MLVSMCVHMRDNGGQATYFIPPALDAFCLLELHKALRAEALGKDPLFNVEPLVTQLPQCKDLVTLIVT